MTLDYSNKFIFMNCLLMKKYYTSTKVTDLSGQFDFNGFLFDDKH